jgi:hypothetical protein
MVFSIRMGAALTVLPDGLSNARSSAHDGI